MNDRPIPNHYYIVVWNTGDKYRTQIGNFYDETSMWDAYGKIKGYDNSQVVAVFNHVFSAIGIEAVENVDTRELIYED